MTDSITVRGVVGTDPRVLVTNENLAITSFRLATTERRLDKTTGTWVDHHTNWYSVTTFRQLASNTAESVRKGDPLIVTGRLRARPWQTDEKAGVSLDIDADSIGHDLVRGTSTFRRSSGGASAAEPESWSPEASAAEPVGAAAPF